MVSAYVSGRKGAEETERRAGGSGGVEHRARDKQVSDRMVGRDRGTAGLPGLGDVP